MNNPTFWWHVTEVVGIVFLIGLFTFGLLRPTSNQKTVVQAGGTKVDYWQGSTVKPGFGGCVTIQAVKTPEVK